MGLGVERGPKITRLVLATSLLVTTCRAKVIENTYPILATPQPDQTPLYTSTIIFPNGTFTPTPTPTPHTTEIPSGAIINGQTGAIYESAINPEDKPGRCVELGYYSDVSKQTVFGAATALGPDRYRYNDHYRFKVFMPDHRTIGSFTTDEIPLDETFGIVPPGTIVCEEQEVYN